MSVLIKGMDMPSNCEECILGAWFTNSCGEDFFRCLPMYKPIDEDDEKRHEYCPLVEVPTPHGRLIDADKLIEEKDWIYFGGGNNAYIKFSDVNYAPIIIEAEE